MDILIKIFTLVYLFLQCTNAICILINNYLSGKENSRHNKDIMQRLNSKKSFILLEADRLSLASRRYLLTQMALFTFNIAFCWFLFNKIVIFGLPISHCFDPYFWKSPLFSCTFWINLDFVIFTKVPYSCMKSSKNAYFEHIFFLYQLYRNNICFDTTSYHIYQLANTFMKIFYFSYYN